MHTPSLQLQLKNLEVKRGSLTLLSHLNARWQRGDLVQLEGHNGIGKTSLLRILAGLATPSLGEVLWQGENIRHQREDFAKALLYLGHQSGIKPELTPWENLRFYQQTTPTLQGSEILWDVLDKVGLYGREDLMASQLSAGQQKRVALARLWLSQAPLWLLDEPFTAIDKQGVKKLTELFHQHTEKGGIVILTSHQPIESDRLIGFSLEPFKPRGEQ